MQLVSWLEIMEGGDWLSLTPQGYIDPALSRNDLSFRMRRSLALCYNLPYLSPILILLMHLSSCLGETSNRTY
jgi:hypothetical protein